LRVCDRRTEVDESWDASATCHNCGALGMSIFYELEDVPVNSCLLLPSREAALAFPKGRIRLGFCESCGFISNVLFDPALVEYSGRYEETQGFSPRFAAFARDLASRLIERYDLRDRDILEIGCGKGEFLALLCELGGNRGIGIDPSYVDSRLRSEAAGRMRFITDFYSESYSHLTADFVCCRHTLEHIQPTQEFLRMVRRSLGDRWDTTVFFEVPDVRRVLRELAFWDIYYEHCSYFTPGSLARLFRSCEFDVLALARDFDDQYLLIDARPGNGSAGSVSEHEDDLEELARDVASFKEKYVSAVAGWKRDLQRIRERGQRAVIWGSGSKAVAYLTTLQVGEEIEFVVDINPFKQGMYLAGSGHKVLSPDALRDYRPDVVIVMNPIYCDEIGRDLDRMGVSAQLITL
jgi:SAM-dependent methyltransferase